MILQTKRVIIALIQFISFSTVVHSGDLQVEASRGWSRGIIAEPGKSDRSYELSLGVINQDGHHLDSTWLYANYSGRGRGQSGLARFEATKDARGLLWPKVRLEVKDRLTGKWRWVGESSGHGQAITVVVKPGSNVDLFIELNAFKQFVDTSKFARVTLTNGQHAEFDLNYLRRPR